MAELTISSDEIRSAIEKYVSSYSPEVSREEVVVALGKMGLSPTERGEKLSLSQFAQLSHLL